MCDTYIPIVLDCGSQTCKVGFGGEEAPREAIPSLVGRCRHPGVTGAMLSHKKDNFCGTDPIQNRGLLSCGRPIQRGRISCWQEMEELLHHSLYSSLEVSTEEHPLLITETPDNSRQDREKLTSCVFEGLNIPAVVIRNTSALSLFSTGRSTGLVVESGAERTHIGPIWDGYTLQHYMRRIDFGGEDLTRRLASILRSEGYPFSTEQDMDQIRLMKEKLCYVAVDPLFELNFCQESRSIKKLYELPDGEEIYMNESRFIAPEIFMNPTTFNTVAVTNVSQQAAENYMRAQVNAATVSPSGVLSINSPAKASQRHKLIRAKAAVKLSKLKSTDSVSDGIEAALTKGWHEVINEAIQCCDPAIRPEMYSSVVLGGGNTLFPKLDERIQREVRCLAPKEVTTKCVAFRNRQYGAWIGGSILASLGTFPCMCVSKAEYDEHGPSVIHRKGM